jgi:hypothetical protein
LATFLSVTGLEYFGRFDTATRTALFYGFFAANGFVLIRYILMPAMSLFELRKTLSYPQAAQIVGQHFSEVKDKLLNTLQLHEQVQNQGDTFSRELILASINQKTQELRPVPFVKAVDYRRNRKYLKYALMPLAILLVLIFQAPKMLWDSTTRLVRHDTFFEAQAPFDFILQNDSLTAIRQQDFTVKLKVKGTELPAEVFLMVDGNPFKMTPKNKTEFSYTLKNLQKDIPLVFTANGFNSRPYTLKVLPKPVLQKFDVALSYPAYLNKKDETLHNVGDLTIPAGTKVSWKFYTENTDAVNLDFHNKGISAERTGENLYTYTGRFLEDDNYYLKTGNRYIRNADSIQYHINVIPDAYPAITLEEAQDSLHLKNMYFTGQISDDYGINRLVFRYRYSKSDDSAKMKQPEKQQAIAIAPGKLMQSFYHFWDLNSIDIKPGDELEYYFEVWDNDGVNGSKSARSQKLFFKAPSADEIQQTAEANNQEMENKMESAIRQATEMQKEMQNVRMKMLDKKSLDWQDKKYISDMLQKQDNLQNTVEELQKQFEKNLQNQNEFKQMDKDLLDKHKQLQDMFNQIMDPETKKMFEELQKLLEENNKEDVQKQLDQMKFQDKEVQKELDRMMELFKQLQFEQKMKETTDKLDKLAEKQDQLSKETEDKAKDKDNKDLQDKQKDLDQKFDDVKKDLEDLQKKNDDLENKNDLDKNDQEQKDIDQEMQKSEQNLESKQNKKASQNQKNAADKMKQMSSKMKQKMQEMQEKAHEEDYQSLRQILENLVYVSEKQEELMDDFKKVNQYNPQYVELAQQQRKLKDDAAMIEDSLLALSKRVMEIKTFVNKEIGEINFNMQNALDALGERNTSKARGHQQFAMTSLNNLALMLSETMQQMQESMKEGKPGEAGQCKKPKNIPGKNQSMAKMKELQDQLSKEIEQMKNGMKPGQQGKPGMSKELAEMAARQEAIRREIQRMNDMLNKSGNQPLGDLKSIQDLMDKNEEDIVNKRITDETVKRQHEIMVRMLESEKAEKKQEYDPDRVAERPKNESVNPSPPILAKYLQAKQKEVEMLRTVPPSLNPYYREKVKEYFESGK